MHKVIKRQRSQNWLNEDKIILRDLIKEQISIISNKNTDSNTNKKKEKAWDYILTRFNNKFVGSLRTLSQVKAQWGLMKMNAKKVKAEKKNKLLKASSCSTPTSQPESGDDNSNWLPIEIKIETNDSDTATSVSTPGFPGLSNEADAKSEKPASPTDLTTEMPECPIFRGTSTTQEPVLCNDSNEQWWCSDDNDTSNVTNSEAAKKKKKVKKTGGASTGTTQSPAAQVVEVETECRRELHKMQMKVASLQVANEEQRAKILRMEEELQVTKIEYYKKKMQFYNRDEESETD